VDSGSVAFSGHLHLRAERRGERTTLAAQSFRAPFHLSKPYWDADARTLLVQIVNPTAGILSGDHLESEINVDTDATLLVTTPSATRVFRMNSGSAECHQRFSVAANGWLEVAPEPLVPHRGCRYRQTTDVEVETGGGLFFIDQVMPGRVGHGEAWSWERLCLELTVRVSGQLVLRERLDQSGAELRTLAEFAGSGAGACFANAVLIAPQNQPAPWLPQLAELHRDGTWVGVSALRSSGWSLKFIAPDPIRLRETLRVAREVLSAHFPALQCAIRKL
jgi:urease accessory protein